MPIGSTTGIAIIICYFSCIDFVFSHVCYQFLKLVVMTIVWMPRPSPSHFATDGQLAYYSIKPLVRHKTILFKCVRSDHYSVSVVGHPLCQEDRSISICLAQFCVCHPFQNILNAGGATVMREMCIAC
jgi:hypothetical protein